MFKLPASTHVNRLIPKNSFDGFANPRQKKLLTIAISKIRWLNKLSSKTINLDGKDIKEIQIIEVTLKKRESIAEITNMIDRVIPYHIIFIIQFENEFRVSASQKHKHPTNENQTVVDWTFISDWINNENATFLLNLQQNLDFVFTDFCNQLSGNESALQWDIKTLITYEQCKKQLTDQIQKLESSIRSCKQFNKKVELNLELQTCKNDLAKLSQRNLQRTNY